MAEGKPVGTMFVELSMDATKYTKAQKDILAGAEKNSADINKVFKTVGTQSDQMYNAMRQNIQNAYNAIAKSATSSADEIRRAHEASAAKISAIDKAQFGEKTSLISSLKSNWISAAAVIGTATMAATKAWDMAKVGASYDEQRGILDNLGRKYNQTADEIVQAMDRAADNQIAKSDLMKIALGGLAKGLDPKQLTDLADAALILGDAVGVDAKTALDDLTQALESGRTKGLKTYLGTSLDLATAFGGLESKMTAVEKTQAMYNLTIQAAAGLQAQQTTKVDGGADAIDRMEKKYNDATLAVSRFFKSMVVGAIDAASAPPIKYKITRDEMGLYHKTVITENKSSEEDDAYLGAAMKAARAKADNDALRASLEKREAEKKVTEFAAKDAIESIRDKQEAEDLYNRNVYEWTVDRLRLEEKMRKDGDDIVKESNKKREEWEKDSQKRVTEGEKIAADFYKDKKKEDAKRAEDRVKAERDIYTDIRGFETESYAASIALIEDQAKKYREMGVSEVAVARWVAEETEKAEIKKLKASKDWRDGIKAYYKEAEKDAKHWGDYSYDVAKAFGTDSRKALSSTLFSTMKGDFENIEDAWRGLMDSMLKKLADSAADMVVSWMETNVTMNSISATSGYVTSGLSALGSYAIGAASDWLGLAVGQWSVPEDKISLLHEGEMVVPAEYAALVRKLMETSGGSLEPGQNSFAASLAESNGWRDSNPFMAELMDNTMTSNIGHSALSGGVKGGITGGLAGALAGALGGALRGGILGALENIGNFYGWTSAGRAASWLDGALAAPGFYNDFNAAIAWNSYQDQASGIATTQAEAVADSWNSYQDAASGVDESGGSTSDGNPNSGGSGEEGWRNGGISSGPNTGYMALMHGTEAHVPLPNGKSIPVEMKGGAQGVVIQNLQLFIGGKEFEGEMKVIADGVVVARNQRNVNPMQRVY